MIIENPYGCPKCGNLNMTRFVSTIKKGEAYINRTDYKCYACDLLLARQDGHFSKPINIFVRLWRATKQLPRGEKWQLSIMVGLILNEVLFAFLGCPINYALIFLSFVVITYVYRVSQ